LEKIAEATPVIAIASVLKATVLMRKGEEGAGSIFLIGEGWTVIRPLA